MTFLAAALLLMSCRQQPTASESLSQAERVACEYPDSTKAYADLLRTAVRKAELEGDAATASRACLLLARQIQWTDEVTALQTARQALQYLDIAEGSVAERLQIQLTIAGLLEQTDSLAQAQSLYYYCLDKAREMQSADEERSALAGLANLLLAEGREAEALDMARQMTFSSGDSDSEARFVLARCYLQCDSLEQARAIYRQIDTHSNTKARYVALRHLTEIALLEGDIETALRSDATERRVPPRQPRAGATGRTHGLPPASGAMAVGCSRHHRLAGHRFPRQHPSSSPSHPAATPIGRKA